MKYHSVCLLRFDINYESNPTMMTENLMVWDKVWIAKVLERS
jgi:hypothetical protein